MDDPNPSRRDHGMNQFLRRHRWAVIVLLGSIAWLAGFALWAKWYSAIPLDAPIVLSRVGHVEQDIEVRSAAPLVLALVFEIGSVPSPKARVLIGQYSPFDALGHRTRPSGIDVPLRWSITDRAGTVRASGEGSTYGRDAFGTTDIFRYVASQIRLVPGRYRLRADVLADLPQLDGMSAHLRLSAYGGKTSSDWRSDLLFFGTLVNLFVISPLAVLIALYLVLITMLGTWKLRRA